MDKKNNFCPIQVETIPFRLTIGVIGHSSLEGIDREIFGKTIDKVLADILGKYPKSGFPDVTLCVLSSFVEGADRFIVNRILDNHPDTWLKLILPLTISEYNDYEKDLFKELKKKSVSSYSLRKQSLADEYAPNSPPKEAEGLAYQDAGKFIVNHCDILIALWDHKQPESRTSWIVKYAREAECPMYIICKNKLSKFLKEGIFDKLFIEGEGIVTFNSNIISSKISRSHIDREFNKLNSHLKCALPDQIQKDIKEKLIPYRLISADIARNNQKTHQSVGIWVFKLAFIALCIVSMGILFFHSHWSVFLLEFFILCYISYLVLITDRKRKTHKNWIEYRFLAERLRSAFFLKVCGVELEPVYANRRVGKLKDTEYWKVMAFEEIWYRILKPSECKYHEDCNVLGDYILNAWIKDQIRYHDSKYKEYEKKNEQMEKWKDKVFYLAAIAALIHLAISLFFHENNWIEHLLTLLTLILPGLAATIESIHSLREYERLTIHHKQMAFELREIEDSFKLLTPEKLEKLLNEIDKIMLKETQEWFKLISFAKLHKAV